MSVKIAISLFVVTLLLAHTAAFQFKTGQCPEVRAIDDFEMDKFLGVWHVVQGTVTGNPVECLTFNLTESDANHFSLTQLPQNLTSDLTVPDQTAPSRLSINFGDTNSGSFNVLVTDYDHFAVFFICRNISDDKFQRAAAILSRTKSISNTNYDLVKQRLLSHDILDEDLTIVLTC